MVYLKIIELCGYEGHALEKAKWIKEKIEEYASAESYDQQVIVPLAILVNLSESEKGKSLTLGEKASMAARILEKVEYDSEKEDEIIKCIKEKNHFNRLLVDDFYFLWKLSEKGFENKRKKIEKSKEEMKRILEQEMEKRIFTGKGIITMAEHMMEDL